MLQEINLYVDDVRRCSDGFVVARNYDEAIELLSSNTINILSLDHDLGLYENVLKRMGMILSSMFVKKE